MDCLHSKLGVWGADHPCPMQPGVPCSLCSLGLLQGVMGRTHLGTISDSIHVSRWVGAGAGEALCLHLFRA